MTPTMPPAQIQELLEKPTITVEELYLSGLLHVSRNKVYEAIGNKVIASVGVGKKLVIPTGPLKRQFGIETVAS
jgi:hypothetical protein